MMTGIEYPGARMIAYPYPLRANLVVWLCLPRDIRLCEVQRLVAFLETLGMDGQDGRAEGNGLH